ncbi:hypothetical protein SpCBS45565_g05773 [Spizellomyces sp. 'palustris']|nr:hypothetical protein SpCBS45565_g05773 [Spizellomyces sp. 'palustris']
MRKIPTNDGAGRSSSPTLSGPSTPTGTSANTFWGGAGTSKSVTPLSTAYGENHTSGSRDHSGGSGWSNSVPSSESSQYRYSREFILSLFDPALPAPYDYEGAPSVTTEEVMPPMANIPLNDHEKKLFTSQSVNSDISARRTPYGRNDSKDGIRPPRPPGSAQRSYSNRVDREIEKGGSVGDNYRPRRADTYAGDEDPWDTPSGVGSFSGNGVFSHGEDEYRSVRNRNSDSGKEAPMLLAHRGRESPVRSASPAPLDKPDTSPGKLFSGGTRPVSPVKIAQSAQPEHGTGAISGHSLTSTGPEAPTSAALHAAHEEDLGRQSVSRTSSFVDMFGAFANTGIKSDLGGLPTLGLGDRHPPDHLNPPPITRSLSRGELHHPPVQSTLPPGIPHVGAAFVPQKWQYKDPSGNVQGPFTAQQMHDWFRSGYFNDDLPIKHVDDFNYEPLARLIQKLGRDRPFLADLEEAEQRAQQIEHQRRFGPGMGLSGASYKDLYQGDVSTPGSLGFNPFNSFGSVAGTPTLFSPNTLGADPFTSLSRDRFGTGGYDPLTGGNFGRPSWGEPQPVGRAGWSGLNTDLSSPFGRPGATPGSPAGNLPGSYFDQRGGVQTLPPSQDNLMSSMGQRQPSPYTPFSTQQAAQSSIQAPQSPAANLFPSQPLLDFAGTSQSGSASHQAGWGNFDGLGGHISGSVSQYSEEAHGPVDVVSKLIDETSLDQEISDHREEKLRKPHHDIVDRFTQLNVGNIIGVPSKPAVDHAGLAMEVDQMRTRASEADKSVARDRKAREEERSNRYDRDDEEGQLRESQISMKGNHQEEGTPGQVAPAVDLRQIMSEQETRSKWEKEQVAAVKNKQLDNELEALDRQKGRVAASAWASGSTERPKLSLKEIQELEQRQREKEDRERQRRAQELLLQQAHQLQEQEALAAGVSWTKDQGQGGVVWGSGARPQPVRQKSLAEIMQEEEVRKRKEAELRGGQTAETQVPTGAGKRYADTIAAAGATGNSAWGLVAASGRPPVAARPAAVIASGNVVKSPAPVPAGGRPDESIAGAWNIVGKQGQVVRPPTQAPVQPIRPAAPPSRPPVPMAPRVVAAPSSSVPATIVGSANQNDGSKGPSSAFMQWCRSALRPLERSTSAGVNVDDFVSILLSVAMNDTATLQMICDDTLGGLTAIDPRKFADEFSKKRRADASGSSISSDGWTAVGPTAPSTVSLDVFDSGNKFVVVGKQSKKKKGKKP